MDSYGGSSVIMAFVTCATKVFIRVSKNNCFASLRYPIGLKNSRHFFIQSEAKPKPVVTQSLTFSRALRQLHVFTSSFDWFTKLSVFFVIG